MASFGVGDAMSIAEKIYKVYKGYVGAEAELYEAVMEVESLRVHRLGFLSKRVEDRRAFISIYGEELASMLKESMKELQTDLKTLSKHLQRWANAMELCKSNWLLGHWTKATFITKDLGKVRDLYQKLGKHDKRIERFLQDLQLHSGAQISEVTKMMREQRKQDAKTDKQNAKLLQQWQELLQKNGVDKVCEAACSTDADLWKNLKKDLMEKGMTEADADSLMYPIYVKLQKLEPPHLARNGPKVKTEGFRILCVDMRNEARSILTQACLELIRVWTANTTGQWLFREVESAGCLVNSKLSRKHRSLTKELISPCAVHTNDSTLKALSAQKYFRSNERQDILDRLALRSTIGISAWHFQHWNYFLCTDQATYDLLVRFRSYITEDEPKKQLNAKVVTPMNIGLHEDLQKTTSEIINAIKTWLHSQLDWVAPEQGIKDGARRTKQMVVSDQSFDVLLAKSQAKKKEIEAFSGCEIRPTYKHQHMISIIGPRKALSQAEELVKKC